jgi:hypothetical protein
MRKISVTIILATIFYSSFSQSYKEQLKKVNDFLKTFDNGYYGYLEIKDGYLYDRFPSGKYSKSEIKYLGKAYESDPGKKVSINCIDGKDCVFSTYTDSYHESIGFSQTYSFNTSQLINLLDNLITAYKKTNGTITDNDDDIDYNAEKRRLEGLKSNIDITSNSSVNKSNTSGNYQSALKKLNDYLKTFDNGYYGYYEVKDGYIYERFKAGKYNKFKMEDMEGAVIQQQYSRVIFKCKGTNKCISTDWKENGKEDYTQFTSSSSYNYQELAGLLNDFKDAYLGNKPTNNTVVSTNTTTTSSTSNAEDKAKAEKALKELNELMVTLDNGRYKGMEVTDGYFINHYKGGESSKAKIEDIDRVEINKEYNYAKLVCKGESKCVYSSITGGYHDYFNFNASASNLTKLETLLKNFLTAVKKCTDKSISSTNTTNASVKTEAQELREQKNKERQSKTKSNEEADDFYWIEEDFDALAKVAPKTNSSSNKYEIPLKNLNEYLKTFNSSTYKDVEVKEGKVYFKFYVYGATYHSYIDINELKNNTIIAIGKSVGSFKIDEVKISCKGGSKCFYSQYSNGPADHFRFFSNTVTDFTKMKQLIEDFIKAL